MKLTKLAEYCNSIYIDCDICEHRNECDAFVSYIEDASPAMIVEIVEEDKEF